MIVIWQATHPSPRSVLELLEGRDYDETGGVIFKPNRSRQQSACYLNTPRLLRSPHHSSFLVKLSIESRVRNCSFSNQRAFDKVPSRYSQTVERVREF